MKHVWAMGWVVLALSLGGGQRAMAEDARPKKTPLLGGFLKETRVIYPLRLGDWEASAEHRFDHAELGVSVRYLYGKRKDRWMDVYFYPAGALSSSTLDQDVSRTLESIRTHAGTPDGYERISIDPVRPFSFDTGVRPRRQRIVGRSASLRFEKDGRAYHSAMALLVKDMYYVKGRFSAQAEAVPRGKAQSQLESLIADLVRQTVVVSTGDCWSPIPIAGAETPLGSGADGALASSENDRPVAADYRDRLEAVEPPSLQAPMVPMSESRSPGCLPPEDLNPEVPAGWREIRIEYRAPNEDGDGTTPRLRSQRYGVT